MDKKKLFILLLVISAISSFFYFNLGHYLSLDYLSSQKEAIEAYKNTQGIQAALIFFGVYIGVTGLSLPGAAVMTLAAGAIFGLVEGTIIVSFASAIGATLAFLVARILFKDAVQARFGESLKPINEGIKRDGALFLFGLRLVPVFPFFVINLVMGLTPIRVVQYFFVSQLGMLPATLIYVNAGTQLGEIHSLSGILSPSILLSFLLLALFPFITKRIMASIHTRKAFKGISKPKRFDTNMVVIGGGSAGLVTSYIAAATKAKVTLIERHKMGGDCLNTGCVPSKALIRSAKMANYYRRASEFGIKPVNVDVDFKAVMERVASIIKKVEPHDAIERYTALGVDCISGSAEIIDPFRVMVNDKIIRTRNIVIATGARPFVPDIPGLENIPYYTSDTLWSLRKRPDNLLIIGGGPIGCELAQSFNRLGIQVTQLDRGKRLLPREDEDVAEEVMVQFIEEGIRLKLGFNPVEFVRKEGRPLLICDRYGKTEEIEFDTLILAVGRKANTKGLGLEKLNIPLNENDTIKVNEFLQTSYPNIFACGDVAGPYQFTHIAAHQAWYAAVNGLFGAFRKFKVDYRVIPWSTFTDPEVARVGLNELEAKAKGIDYEVTHYDINELDRAIADSEDHGFIKILTVPHKDKILGVTIVGHHAGELIAEYVTAMKYNLGLNKILGTIHIYPTLTESNKYAAGEWKRAHVPAFAMKLLNRFHAWNR
jgi:pyruvate/2-oxoglutarate dehydrogenase complex dihydrolipoamide dehydrogenase (E3) component/uncharacterized membrane protein YdjX (TVP38/TMEM64 family)